MARVCIYGAHLYRESCCHAEVNFILVSVGDDVTRSRSISICGVLVVMAMMCGIARVRGNLITSPVFIKWVSLASARVPPPVLLNR